MSTFYAELKHHLVKTDSEAFKNLKSQNSEISNHESLIKSIAVSTGLKVYGYANFSDKKYFLIGKINKYGNLVEIPISTSVLSLWLNCPESNVYKHRFKKALKREDFVKSSIEIKNFVESQDTEAELTII